MKPLLILLLACLSCCGARAAFTNRLLLGPMSRYFEAQNADGSVAMYPRGAKPFRLGIYLGPTNAAEQDLELVCIFTNEAILPVFWHTPGTALSFVTAKYAPGTNISVQVRGWPMELGASYEEAWTNDTAKNGAFGRTSIGVVTLTSPPAVAPFLFGRRLGPLDYLIIKPRSP